MKEAKMITFLAIAWKSVSRREHLSNFEIAVCVSLDTILELLLIAKLYTG